MNNVLVCKGPIPPCIKRAITDSSDVMNIALVLKGPIPPCIKRAIITRVSHITPFFELSLVLLTTHAIGLYEVTKKFQRRTQKSFPERQFTV